MLTFLKQYTTYGLGIALTRLAALLLLPLYTRYLTTEDYGVLDTLMTMVTFLAPVLFLGGMDMGVQILFFSASGKQEQDDLVMTTFALVAGFAGLCALGGIITASLWSRVFFGSDAYSGALRLLLTDLWFTTMLKLFLDNLRLRQKPGLYNLFTLTQILFVTASNVFLVVVQRGGVLGYITGLMIGDAIVCAASGVLALRHHLCKPTFGQARSLLRISVPLLPMSAAYWVLNLSNRFFLAKWTTLADVGLYGIANRLATGIGVLALAMQVGWRPFALSIQSKPSARSLYAAMLLYYFAVVGAIGLGVTAFARWLLAIFATEAYAGAATLIAPLILGQIVYGAYYILSTGLEIRQQTYHLTWTVAVAAIFTVVGNFLFIPLLGTLGAALIIALAYGLAALLVGLVSQRAYPLPYDWRRLAMLLVCVFGGSLAQVLLFKFGSSEAYNIALVAACEAVMAIIMLPEIKNAWRQAETWAWQRLIWRRARI